MKVLITGSSGFIGRWTANCLANSGIAVFGLDKKFPEEPSDYINTYICNILDRPRLFETISEISPDAIIHLAARTDLDETNELNGYSDNIAGVQNLIDAVRNTPSIRRVIYTSSQLVCKVGYIPNDDFDYCPHTLYGESKVLTEKIVRENDGGCIEWCITRPTTVWGPFMNKHYQNLLRLIQKGWYFHCGKKPLYKSYSYAGNIAYQYSQLLLAPSASIHRKLFYLADYEPLCLKKYADELSEAMNAPSIKSYPILFVKLLALTGDVFNKVGIKSFPFNSFRLNNILTCYQFDLNKTKAICGPLPYTFEDGIKATAKWFVNQK